MALSPTAYPPAADDPDLPRHRSASSPRCPASTSSAASASRPKSTATPIRASSSATARSATTSSSWPTGAARRRATSAPSPFRCCRGASSPTPTTASTRASRSSTPTAARRLWPDANPIGKMLTPWARKELHYTVVGVVGDVRDVALGTPPDATVYLSGRNWASMTFLLHTAGDPHALGAAVRDRVRTVNPNIPVTLSTLDETLSAVGRAAALRRHHARRLLVGGADAGDDGHLQRHLVLRRAADARDRHSHGARRAARRHPAHGAAAAASCSRRSASPSASAAPSPPRACWSSLLYSVGATDPLVFAVVTLLLALVAVAASALAGRRATAVDPMVALRSD